MQSGSYLPSLGTRVSLTCIGLLLLFFGILGMGLSTELQVLRADQRIDSLAQLVREQDAADAELRRLRLAIGDATRAVERGEAVDPERLQALRDDAGRFASGDALSAVATMPESPAAVRDGIARTRAGARAFGMQATALLDAAERDGASVKAGMPAFLDALKTLESSRTATRQSLVEALQQATAQSLWLGRRGVISTAFAALVALLFTIGLAVWLRRRVMVPIVHFAGSLRRLSAGQQIDQVAGVDRQDELGMLARGLVTMGRAMEERRRIEAQVEFLAHHDPLTGLANRLLFEERLARTLAGGAPCALLAIDLDGFKGVNDTLGHAAGDAVLRRMAAVLIAASSSADTVARMGGDEFAIIHPLPGGAIDAAALVDRIFALAAGETAEPSARFSIGVALAPLHATQGDELYSCADIALYRAKADGRNRARLYDGGMDEERRQRRWMAHELRDALNRGQMHVVFQPIANCATGAIVGYEALARWTHPALGAVSPAVFVPVAEENGLMGEIGDWILEEALAVASGWPATQGIAVNLSPEQLRDPALAARLLGLARAYRIAAHRIEVEVTEGVVIDEREVVVANLRALQSAGVGVVMDDFGTGCSSLSSLQQFGFNKIKIDRSFVANMRDDRASRSIVRATIGLGRSLDMLVVAEGVETEEQMRMLRAEGCAQVQGYLVGAPAKLTGAVAVTAAG